MNLVLSSKFCVHRKNEKFTNYELQTTDQKGQSLLEVLTALGVAVLVIVGLSSLAVYGLRNAQHAKNTETATRLTGQATEQVRTVRDRVGWAVFRTYSVNTCYIVDATNWTLTSQSSCGGIALTGDFSQFSREIKLLQDTTNCPGECRKVTVTVFWTDSQGTNQVSTNTFLTQWQ